MEEEAEIYSLGIDESTKYLVEMYTQINFEANMRLCLKKIRRIRRLRRLRRIRQMGRIGMIRRLIDILNN